MLFFWPFLIAKQGTSMTSQGWVNQCIWRIESETLVLSTVPPGGKQHRVTKWYCPSCDAIIIHLIFQHFFLNIFPNAFLKVSLCKGTWGKFESIFKGGEKLWLNFREKILVSKIQDTFFFFLANILQPFIERHNTEMISNDY